MHEGEEFNASAKERQAIGFLTYHPESKMDYDFLPESCSASVAVAAPAFLAMWHLVSQGRLPDWISVSVEDMTYGYDPDGREKIWNIDANRSVAVKEVDFRFPVAAVPKRTSASEEELDTDPIGLPATSSDIQAASAQLGEVLANYHVSIKKELRYLIGVAALIALVLLFR